jgi:hypothetical protein
MTDMYKDTDFSRYWAQCEPGASLHPEDAPFLKMDKWLAKSMQKIGSHVRVPASFQTEYPASPFDGPINKAKLVLCLANPNYENLDKSTINRIVREQRCGEAELPKEWDAFYEKKIARPLNLTMDKLRQFTAVINLCPYASSPYMGTSEMRLAAGLPSVWAAQKFLREELIPRAKKKEIYLVFTRKHQLWGVHEGFESSNILISRKNPIEGKIPDDKAEEIVGWLRLKGVI